MKWWSGRHAILAAAIGLLLLVGSPTLVRAFQADTPAGEAAHAEEHAAASEEGSILSFQPPLAFWTVLVFGGLLLVLWKFAWGPLAKALHDREHNLTQTLERSEQAQAESQRLLAEHRSIMNDASKQVSALLDEARRTAVSSAEEIRRVAQQEAELTLKRAQGEIATAKDQALLALWNQTAGLAVGLAGRVLDRELTPEDHRRLIDVAMNELPAQPDQAAHQGQGS